MLVDFFYLFIYCWFARALPFCCLSIFLSHKIDWLHWTFFLGPPHTYIKSKEHTVKHRTVSNWIWLFRSFSGSLGSQRTEKFMRFSRFVHTIQSVRSVPSHHFSFVFMIFRQFTTNFRICVFTLSERVSLIARGREKDRFMVCSLWSIRIYMYVWVGANREKWWRPHYSLACTSTLGLTNPNPNKINAMGFIIWHISKSRWNFHSFDFFFSGIYVRSTHHTKGLCLFWQHIDSCCSGK